MRPWRQSKYTAAQIDNQKSYLYDKVNSSNPGEVAWAKQELNKLNQVIDGNIGSALGAVGGSGYGNGNSQNRTLGNTEGFDQYQSMLYEQQLAEQAAKRAAIEAGVGRLNAQKPLLQQQTDKALQQAYIQNALGNKNMAQGLAASGYTGGLSEGAKLGSQLGYEGVLSETKQAGQNALNSVDQDIANLQSTGDLEVANTGGKYADLLANAYMQTLSEQRAQQNWQNQFDYGRAADQQAQENWQSQFAYGKSQDNYSNALKMLNSGLYSPDMAGILGLRDQEIQKYLNPNAYANQLAQTTYKNRAGGSINTKTKPDTENKAEEPHAYKQTFSGLTGELVRNTLSAGKTKKDQMDYLQSVSKGYGYQENEIMQAMRSLGLL